MRDRADNCVIICSIENVDPMGVHTGDSITVAPAQTLTDVEYQQMRDAAIACIRRVGVETGGSNVQFAVDPGTGRQVVIEMNPRVSRSSALASKATGFPIAKIAAKLAVGYTLDEIPNDITQGDAGQLRAGDRLRRHQDPALGVREAARHDRRPRHADAVGRRGDGDRPHVPREPAEGAALARTGPARAQLRPGRGAVRRRSPTTNCSPRSAIPTPERIFQVGELLRRGVSVERVHDACRIDPWFLDQMLADRRGAGRARESAAGPADDDAGAAWRRAKRLGFSDAQLAYLWGSDEVDVRTAPRGRRRASRPTRRSTPAPPSSPPRRRTTTRPTRTRARSRPSTARRSSSSAPARTASARASSSTTAACTPASPSARPASRR